MEVYLTYQLGTAAILMFLTSLSTLKWSKKLLFLLPRGISTILSLGFLLHLLLNLTSIAVSWDYHKEVLSFLNIHCPIIFLSSLFLLFDSLTTFQCFSQSPHSNEKNMEIQLLLSQFCQSHWYKVYSRVMNHFTSQQYEINLEIFPFNFMWWVAHL